MRTIWRLWSKALGEKASTCNQEADRIAIIRSIIFATYLITNCFIVAGVLRHWNDSIQNHEVSGHLSKTKKEKIINSKSSILYN